MLLPLAFAVPIAQAQVATTTALTITSNGSPVTSVSSGTAITLTATVLAGSTPVTPGLVNFCDATAAHCTDIHLLGSAQLTSNGTASMHLIPGPGSHSYKAVFVGTRGVTTSTSSTASLAVTQSSPYSSAITLAPTGSGGSYIVTATVGGNKGPLPTGTVSFVDASNGNAPIGTVTLGSTGLGLEFATDPFDSPGPGSVTGTAIADFNGDGIPDLAVVNNFNQITIFLGNGTGQFLQHVILSTGTYTIASVHAADLNSDGIPDLLLSCTDGTYLVKLGDGQGNFGAEYGATFGITLAVGDFNGDGVPDLVAVGSTDGFEGPGSAPLAYTLLGNGDGSFPFPPASFWSTQQAAIVTADFNGDGNLDVAILNGYNSPLHILLGNGDGTFTAAPTLSGGVDPTLAVADFNGDGIPDLITDQGVWLGNGDGTFGIPKPGLSLFGNFNAIADFNGDGIADVAASTASEGPAVYLGVGDGTFGSPNNLAITGSYPAALADFNGDGLPDFGLINSTDNTISAAFTYLYSVNATQNVTLAPATGTHQLNVTYSGDSNYSGSTATINLASASSATPPSISFTPSINPSVFGASLTLTATIAGGGTTPTGTVAFTDNGRQLGSFAVSSGTALYTTSSLSLGQHAIQATYSGDANYAAGSATITETVQPSPALTLTPSTLPAGLAGAAYIQTLSAAGGTAPYTYTLSNGSLPVGLTLGAGGTLSGTPTSSGAFAFAVTATDSSISMSTGSQSYTLTINQAPASAPTITLTPTSLPDGTVGSAYNQTLSATGGTAPYFYAVTSGTLPVGLALANNGILSGTASAAGNATFTITATDSSSAQYTGTQSYSFNINASPALNITATTSSTQTISAGGSAAFTFAVSSSSGSFPGTVQFAATGLPSGATAKFDPSSLPAGSGSATVTMTIQTAGNSSRLNWPAGETALGLLLLPIIGMRRVRDWNRHLRAGMLLAAVFTACALTGLAGCSGASIQGKPSSYIVTVSVTSGTINQTIPFALNIN